MKKSQISLIRHCEGGTTEAIPLIERDCFAMLAMTVFSLFCFVCSLHAQITIDSSDFPIGGVKLPREVGFIWGGTAGNPGANQSYDFSNTGTFWKDTVFYTGDGETPFFNEHPGASVAGFEWWRDSFLMIWYYTADNNAIWASGATAVGDFGQGDTAIHANYLPAYTDTLLSTGYIYGNAETEFSTISLPLNPSADLKLTSFKYIEVDGWGTLKTPYKNWDSILRVRYVEFNFDTLFVGGVPDTIVEDTLFYYKYFAKGIRHPVVIAHTNFFGEIKYLEYIYTDFPPAIYGCTDSLAVNFNPLANKDDNNCIYCNAINYTITPDTGICEGGGIVLTATGSTNYLWSTGETTNSISVNPDSTTVYSVWLSDTSACLELAAVEVKVYNDVQAGFWVDPNTLSDSVLFVNTSTGATAYFWDFNDTQNGTSTEENPKHLYSTSGTKNVMLIASNPCSADTFYSEIIATGIYENHQGFENFSIYPNPFSISATVRINRQYVETDGGKIQFELYDLLGRKIKQQDITGNETEIHRDNLLAGFYIYKLVVVERTLTTGKVIIQ